MTDKLKAAFLEKERVELFLSNLDKLKDESGLEGTYYEALKNEYQIMREKALSKITALKYELQKKLDAKIKELSIDKLNIKYLEVRYKVGQIPPSTYMRQEQKPRKKISDLEKTISYLQSLINSSKSSDILVPYKKSCFLSGLGGRKEPDLNALRQMKTSTVNIVEKKSDQPLKATVVQEPVVVPEPKVEEPVIQLPPPPPPGLIVTNLQILPDRVTAGSHVGIIAIIKNNGQQDINYRLELKINNEVKDYYDVSLATGKSEEITFLAVASEPGEYQVEMAGLYGRFTVL